jgi:hypothetical protein
MAYLPEITETTLHYPFLDGKPIIVHIPAQTDHRFWRKPITDSGVSRSRIPAMPITVAARIGS